MMSSSSNPRLPSLTNRVTAVHVESLVLEGEFSELVRCFANVAGTIALMSGGRLDCARYHVLGIWPWLTMTASRTEVTLATNGVVQTVAMDPFDGLRAVLDWYRIETPVTDLPLSSGLLGYLAYDLKDCLEKLPRTSFDDLTLPLLYFVAPRVLVVHRVNTHQTTLLVPRLSEGPSVEDTVAEFKRRVAAASADRRSPCHSTGAVTSAFSRAEYLTAVETIREYIRNGDVYQVNMSQRFRAQFEGDPFELFAETLVKNPAPFFAYINAGDHWIVSTSPERFIRLDGTKVETRPIKGTRPRGNGPERDAELKRELETSRKDDAELSMIVDLLRNDIGKVCREGTVRVTEHKRLEAYENVYHLVSIVEGELDPDKDAIDLLRATFPGGSITGCPKIRSMEIIDELEPVRRHVYTGSIGYLSFHGTMDLSIAIRTATFVDRSVLFSVGGGIVYDSDAVSEYEETLHKGSTLFRALASKGPQNGFSPIAWYNGGYRRLDDVRIAAESEALLYGYGFFETIRVQRNRPLLLEAHVARFDRAWRSFFVTEPPDVSWYDVISELIARNALGDRVAAVKLLAGAGKPGHRRPSEFVLATAREYTHRLAGKSQAGLRVAVYPHPRETYLAEHKTMNYMLYKLAGAWAKDHGADEALLLNPDGTVSETNTANICCLLGGKVCFPTSAHALSGTMAGAIRRVLSDWGIAVEQRKLHLEELVSADGIILTNALMGAVPVVSLDGQMLSLNTALCERLNTAVFGDLA